MSRFSTTNSTYGSFYLDIQNKVKEDQEKQKRQSNQSYNYPQKNYQNNNYHNTKNDIQNIPRARTPINLLKDSSIVGNISCSLTGLQNLGNTCYINTCLQNLIHCTPFISRFLEISNTMFQKNIRPCPISDAFYELLIQIYDNNHNEQNDYINPCNFVDKLTSIHSHFYGNQEHDTQELCRFLLQDFNCELNEVINPSSYKTQMPKGNKKQMFFNYKNDCLSKENSLITDLFIGYFSFEYVCECGYKEYTFSQFLDLPIQMNSGIKGFDLFQMIHDNFYRTSYVDMGENCDFCRRTSKKREIMKIASLPQILIISLQRIDQNGKKNETPIKFYEGIDLKGVIDSEIADGSSTKYNLFAVSNHIGQINTGHYYNYIKIGKNWYCFEDSKVFQVGYQIEMTSKEVYTLFYSRSNIK